APSGDPTPTDPAPTYGHGHDPPPGFHILSSPPHRQWSPRTATTRRPLAGGHPPRTRASQQERSRRRYLESPARASPSAEVAIRRMAGPLPASWDSRISLGNSPRPTLQRVEPLFEELSGGQRRVELISALIDEMTSLVRFAAAEMDVSP